MVAVRCRFIFLLFLFLFLSLSLSPYLSVSLSEQEALLQFKKSLTNTTALDDSWVTDPSPPCQSNWTGVGCGNNATTVVKLDFSDMGLSGTINVDALAELKNLRYISLDNNNFAGAIPDFTKLVSLRTLNLTGNKFTGQIAPDLFANLTSLRFIDLSNNNFSGDIPFSIVGLYNLRVLTLNNNQFSGEIPIFLTELKDLAQLNLQNNKLEGDIPDPLSKKFAADTFQGNEGLCGPPLDKQCPKEEEEESPEKKYAEEEKKKKSHIAEIVIGVICGVAVLLFIWLVVRYRRKEKKHFSVLGKEKMNNEDHHAPHEPHREEVVEVHVPTSTSNKSVGSTGAISTPVPAGIARTTSVRKAAGESKKGSQVKNSGNNELLMVSDLRGPFGLPDLMKAAAEVLGNGGLGSAYKAVMGNGLSVVVKRMREMNRLGREGFDAEMRRFGRLRHKNILTPLAYHYRREEKLLISDYIPRGSLLYVLHGDRGTSHSELTWATRLKIIQGVASGMEFLHTEFAAYDLPHGNLKSSNILLKDDYEPVLNDYALHPLINPNNAAQSLFAFKTPEYLESQEISPQADVYCLGIVVLEILTGKFPSQYLSNGKGGIDVVQWVQSATAEQGEQELLDPEIESNTESVKKQMLQLLKIGADCTESKPDQRPDMKEAVKRILEVKV